MEIIRNLLIIGNEFFFKTYDLNYFIILKVWFELDWEEELEID